MSDKLNIIKYPNPILEKKAEKIKNPTDPETQKLIQEMIEAMRKANGLGLAAPQIGKSIQLCIIEEGGDLFVLINPKITAQSKEKVRMDEGCLSFPGEFKSIERPERVKVRYLNERGEKAKIKADGLLARALQHEIDHLNGILFINRIKK